MKPHARQHESASYGKLPANLPGWALTRPILTIIADHAEIGRGTLYLYFESKREVFIAMLQSIAERQLAAARAALAEGKTLQEHLEALLLAFIRLATEDADGFHVYMSALYGVNRAFQTRGAGAAARVPRAHARDPGEHPPA